MIYVLQEISCLCKPCQNKHTNASTAEKNVGKRTKIINTNKASQHSIILYKNELSNGLSFVLQRQVKLL